MKLLKGFFAFYINSSIHVSLAVTALLVITVLEYKLHVPKVLWVFTFFGALMGYNFVKYAKIAGLHHRSLTKSLKSIQVFSAGCFVLLCILALQLSYKVLLTTAVFGVLTFFYAVPVLKNKSLRRFSSIKIFVVAVVWSGITVVVPIIAAETFFSTDMFLTFFQRALLVIALLLPFEIRDVHVDVITLKTLPQQLGVWNTKLVGQAMLFLSFVFELFKENSMDAHSYSLLFFSFVLGWLILVSKTEQPRYFASFWVEGLPIIWCLLFVLLK